MCQVMAAELPSQEEFPEKHFKKQLAATVRNIQWSYSIFWSTAAKQQGVLAWDDGYYNGEIKTRKTTQPMEFKADQMGMQRSEQLRELYESLSAGDNNQQTKRPSASLSPEDLTATEWYYLVCMSFTFGPGQGMPGRSLASNQHIWLSNAQFADNKTFSRSLLAKSASVQTVVCFPFMGGVLELGTTEVVLEDPSLIQHVTSSFWSTSIPVCSEQSISSLPMEEKDEDNVHTVLERGVGDSMTWENHNLLVECQTPLEGGLSAFPCTLPAYTLDEENELIPDKVEEQNPNVCEELKIVSPDNSSNECYPNHHTDDSLRMEGLNGLSQVQSRQLMDDEFSNGLHVSLNSSDCISQSFANPQKLSSPKGERVQNHVLDYLQGGKYTKLVSLDIDGDESHYARTISAILSNSKQPASEPCFTDGSRESSFTVWESMKRGTPNTFTGTSQKVLKKILIDAARIHDGQLLKPPEENGNRNKAWKLEGDDAGASHMLSERRRREKLNEKFLILKSLVPSISKVDKASILGDTIEYLKELERRVEELESCREREELEARGRRKHPDVAERTSDNYRNNKDMNARKLSASKRKACDIEEPEAEYNHWALSKDGAVDINVTVTDKEVLIEMHCPWRDCLLVEIVEAISSLHLDAHSVQSSTNNGTLALTLNAKFRDGVVASPGMIKRALQGVLAKC